MSADSMEELMGIWRVLCGAMLWCVVACAFEALGAGAKSPKSASTWACKLSVSKWNVRMALYTALEVQRSTGKPFLTLSPRSSSGKGARVQVAFSRKGPTAGAKFSIRHTHFHLEGWRRGKQLKLHPRPSLKLRNSVVLPHGNTAFSWTGSRSGQIQIQLKADPIFRPTGPVRRWVACSQLTFVPKNSNSPKIRTKSRAAELHKARDIPLRATFSGPVVGHLRFAKAHHAWVLKERKRRLLIYTRLHGHDIKAWVSRQDIAKRVKKGLFGGWGVGGFGCITSGRAFKRRYTCSSRLDIFLKRGTLIQQIGSIPKGAELDVYSNLTRRQWVPLYLDRYFCTTLGSGYEIVVPRHSLRGCRTVSRP